MSVKAPSAVEAGGAFLLYENHAIVAWFREALAVSNKKLLMWYDTSDLPVKVNTH